MAEDFTDECSIGVKKVVIKIKEWNKVGAEKYYNGDFKKFRTGICATPKANIPGWIYASCDFYKHENAYTEK